MYVGRYNKGNCKVQCQQVRRWPVKDRASCARARFFVSPGASWALWRKRSSFTHHTKIPIRYMYFKPIKGHLGLEGST